MPKPSPRSAPARSHAKKPATPGKVWKHDPAVPPPAEPAPRSPEEQSIRRIVRDELGLDRPGRIQVLDHGPGQSSQNSGRASRPPGGPVPPPPNNPAAEIDRELTYLACCIDSLEKAISVHRDRLTPVSVVTPAAQPPSGLPPQEPVNSSVGSRLQESRLRLIRLTESLSDATAILAV